MRLSIGGKLLMAFGAMAALTAVSAAVSLAGLARIDAAFAQLTSRDLPAATLAGRVAVEASRLGGQAGVFIGAETRDQIDELVRGLDDERRRFRELIQPLLAAEHLRDDAADLGRTAQNLVNTLDMLGNARLDAFDLADRLDAEATALQAARDEAASALFQMTIGSQETILGTLNIIDVMSEQDRASAITDLTRHSVPGFRRALNLAVAAERLVGLSLTARAAKSHAALQSVRTQLAGWSAQITAQLGTTDPSQEMQAVRKALTALVARIDATDGVAVMREQQLGAEAREHEIAKTAKELAERAAQLSADIAGRIQGDAAMTADDVAALVSDGRSIQLSLTGAALLIAGLLLWLVVMRSIVRRLRAITRAMGRIADGDLACPIPASGRDEVAQMAQALAVFRDNAAEVVAANARAEAEKTRAQAEKKAELLKLAQAFDLSVNRVVETVAGSAARLQVAAHTMSDTARGASERSASVAAASDQASSNVQTVATAAEELTSAIAEIGRQVARSSAFAADAVRRAEETDHTVRGLADGAARIGEVVRLINEIATQTNLLALNATIEAARAGDAGRGFAVVASEVKTLAGQTAKATEEISQQVTAIQESTQAAVKDIHEIGDLIEEMSAIASAIAGAVEEQGAATAEIARNVSQAAEGTREVSGSVHQLADAAAETGRVAGDMLGAADELAQGSTHLKEEVDRFLGEVRAA